MRKSLQERLAILADAAKYGASCAPAAPQGAMRGRAVSARPEGMGICHAYAPDGRCISLLKILLTNFCIYDCAYCINRSSNNVQRARFPPQEVVWLVLEFYRRNYIKGLFLSSGIAKSSDHTMEQMVRIARDLQSQDGPALLPTWHPSWLLRLPDPALARAATGQFESALRRAGEFLAAAEPLTAPPSWVRF